jgi:hypothetical protein
MYNRFTNSPSASNASLSMAARNTVPASSSRWPGISTVISTQSLCPCLSSSSAPPSSSSSTGSATGSNPPSSSSGSWPSLVRVFSTSALTPTMASVPSAKHTRALPLAPGKTPVSADTGRNWFGARPSGRRGGRREREACR